MKSSLAFLRAHVAPALIAFTAAWALAKLDFVERFENITLDRRTVWRAQLQPNYDPLPFLVGVDDLSVEKFGFWPWPRKIHGQFIANAAKAKAGVVVWDVIFAEADEANLSSDDVLVQGTGYARAHGTEVVFGGFTFDDITPDTKPGLQASQPLTEPVAKIEGNVERVFGGKYLAPPMESLQVAAPYGMVDTPPGFDGSRRMVPLLVRVSDRVYFHLSLQAVLQVWRANPADVRVRLGDAIYVPTKEGERRIPIDASGRYLVNYRFGYDEAPKAGYWSLFDAWQKALAGKGDGQFPSVEGKLVLVGQVATGMTDNGPSPFSGHTPLVLVHANIVDNILRNDYAHRSPTSWVWLAGVAVSIGGLATLSRRRLLAQAAFSLGVPLLYAGIALFAWVSFSLWLPLIWPLLGFGGVQVFMISRRLIAEQRAKAEIKGMFGTYVSPALVNQMIESGQRPQLGGVEDEITAYFSDIQGFSSFSEKLVPERLVELMNEYLTACTDIVQEEGGTLDKYIGDAVVAMFGAPLPLPDHAYRACVATQRVHQQLGVLRERWKAEGDKWPEIVWKMQSRIGLNTGTCVIGNMGSRTRFNYTMMGDNVNLAARMESGAKSWGVYTMCTDATKAACEQHGGDRVVFRALGRIVVMGRSQPVPIYEITGLKETLVPSTRDCIAEFETALASYYARDWAGAIVGFRRSAELEPNQPGKTPGVKSNPSLVYIKIAESYALKPPPENWEGVYVMTEK